MGRVAQVVSGQPVDGRLVARRPFRCGGRDYLPGEVLDPQPAGVLRQRLVDHRFVVTPDDGSYVDDTAVVVVRNLERIESEAAARRLELTGSVI